MIEVRWDEADGFSFEDSDRFEEDSIGSWMSEPESVCSNWRGWKKCCNFNNNSNSNNLNNQTHINASKATTKDGQVLNLVELAAREVACHIPFEVVEHFYPPVPEQLQLRIAYWSFPENDEDIRLYSCLANGSSDEFCKGENLMKSKAVKDLLQIGFHLSATVTLISHLGSQKGLFNVAVTIDRRRITSCSCTCNSRASWCSHVVAVCLHRIHYPAQVCLRAPVSESLSRLHRDQLQKFAQYLISELPQQILPTAQRLLDDLLSNQQTTINTLSGAPDPTAGASVNEQTTWCLDESQIHENVHKILIKLCVPSPIVFSDVNYLSYSAHPAAAEWASLLRPLRGREPEGMWNLLSIVREMFRRCDRNAIPLLEILTEEVLAFDQIIHWWFNTRVTQHAGTNGHGNRGNPQGNASASQHACSSLCDEIVILWRLACLNPTLSDEDRKAFQSQLYKWHLKTLEKVFKLKSGNSSGNGGNGNGNNGGNSNNNGNNNNNNGNGNSNNNGIKMSDFEVFPGFKPAIEASQLDWDDYPLPGVTYTDGIGKRWFNPIAAHAHQKDHLSPVSSTAISASGVSAVNCKKEKQQQQLPNEFDNEDVLIEPSGCSGKNFDLNSTSSTLTSNGGSGVCGNVNANANSVIMSETSTVIEVKNIREQAGDDGLLLDSNRSSFSSEGFCETSETEQIDSDTLAVCGNSGNIENNKIDNESIDEMIVVKSLVTQNDLVNSSNEDDVLCCDISNVLGNCGDNNTNSNNVVIGNESGAVKLPKVPQITLKLQDEKTSKTPAVAADEYQLYRYDTSIDLNVNSSINSNNSNGNRKLNAFDEQFNVNVKKIDDPIEILFARAEALHAHGFSREASQLAVKLAEELLSNPPNLMIELPNPPARGKRARRFNPSNHQNSLLASTTLSKAAFLCSVLFETVEHHYLAFQVGIFGLELARPPASTKALEVKLANQEQDLVALLKRIPLAQKQLQVLREKAQQLRDGKHKSRGDALLPLMLASYIFDALVVPTGNPQTRAAAAGPGVIGRLPNDLVIGFEAAVAALGLKANVSEAEHPLLCEGTRRQRGELAITLLMNYKDDREKLSKIMDKLLDKDVHQMYKNNSNCVAASISSSETLTPSNETPNGPPSVTQEQNLSSVSATINEEPSNTAQNGIEFSPTDARSSDNVRYRSTQESNRRRGQIERRPSDGDRSEGASSPCWAEDYKAWEARFRCTNLKTAKKHSVGMASIDSSAPETTSSDNSPTVVRRSLWVKPGGGPGSDSGSSGESSDSFASSSSGDKNAKKEKLIVASLLTADTNNCHHSAMSFAAKMSNCSIAENSMKMNLTKPASSIMMTPSGSGHLPQTPINSHQVQNLQTPISTSSSNNGQAQQQMPINNAAANINVVNGGKSNRFKGKRINPSIPNQPSQASAHFMFELAKTVLTKAGGNSSSGVLFSQPSSNQNHRLPHRALHMCAFQIGVYALGLHNAVTPNWLSRTYSSNVSWITGQAFEIGAAAINFLIDTWEGHLTPPEVASLADRASRGRDRNMVRAAAKLALSCLPHASALNPNEIQRALTQCRELSSETLEQACLAIERAASGGGVYPEVLFEVARNWYELYEESLPKNGSERGSNQNNAQSNSNENFVQASIGEFQVPIAATNNSNYNLITEAQILNAAAQERQAQNESILSVTQTSHAANVGQFAPLAPQPPQIPIQMLQQPGGFNLPQQPQVIYRFSSGIPSFPSGPLPLHPAYLQGPPSFQYPYFSPASTSNATAANAAAAAAAAATSAAAAVAALPHLRSTIITNPVFTNQALLSNVMMAQHVPITQAQRLQLIPTAGPSVGQMVIPVCTPIAANNQQDFHFHSHFSFATVQSQPQEPLQRLTQRQLNYLLSAYRVGMLAMDILARRVHDDRPQTKYARNPSYGEDVKWLLGIAKKLGTSYLQEFCICTVNSVASPFILLDIIAEVVNYLQLSTTAPLRSPIVTPLIQKCQQMFISCTHFKMYHITPADYEEFVQIIRSARQAYQLTPGGMVQFNEFLQTLRRSKSYKKELWQYLNNALQQPPQQQTVNAANNTNI